MAFRSVAQDIGKLGGASGRPHLNDTEGEDPGGGFTTGPPPVPPGGGLPTPVTPSLTTGRDDERQPHGIRGLVQARQAAQPFKYGFVSGPFGMSYSLQGQQGQWGNPEFEYKRGRPTGYADARYYTGLQRPMYDFTTEGGGVMPTDPFKKIGGS